MATTEPRAWPTAEHTVLLSYLEEQRRHVLEILDGLTEAELRRPILPSGWTCLELVRHLTMDVEVFWFRATIAGEPEAIAAVHNGVPAPWYVGPDVSSGAVLEAYRVESHLANAVIRARPLDARPAWCPEPFAEWRTRNLREVILHVLVETACHAGHLDAARELVDGRKWLDLTSTSGSSASSAPTDSRVAVR